MWSSKSAGRGQQGGQFGVLLWSSAIKFGMVFLTEERKGRQERRDMRTERGQSKWQQTCNLHGSRPKIQINSTVLCLSLPLTLWLICWNTYGKQKHKLSRFMNTRMAFSPGFSRLLRHKRLPNQHWRRREGKLRKRFNNYDRRECRISKLESRRD